MDNAGSSGWATTAIQNHPILSGDATGGRWPGETLVNQPLAVPAEGLASRLVGNG